MSRSSHHCPSWLRASHGQSIEGRQGDKQKNACSEPLFSGDEAIFDAGTATPVPFILGGYHMSDRLVEKRDCWRSHVMLHRLRSMCTQNVSPPPYRIELEEMSWDECHLRSASFATSDWRVEIVCSSMNPIPTPSVICELKAFIRIENVTRVSNIQHLTFPTQLAVSGHLQSSCLRRCSQMRPYLLLDKRSSPDASWTFSLSSSLESILNWTNVCISSSIWSPANRASRRTQYDAIQ